MRTLKSYWYRPDGFTNFGDELGRMILERLGFTVEWSPLSEADIITTGTLLNQAVDEAKDGLIVWGSGLGHYDRRIDRFKLLAVRGQLTSRDRGLPMGDPALLAPLFWPPAPAKLYRIGVVRHYVDKNIYPFADIEISAMLSPEEVIKKITQCEFIVSSSLHGIIIATAYGIPCMRAFHPDIIAGDYKFADFMTSLDRPVTDIQRGLLAAAERI